MILTELNASEIAAGYAAGTFSAEEVVRAHLEAIRASDLNAYITVNPEALTAARAADRARASGRATPYTGVPVAIKDVLMTAGMVTTAGSRMLKHYIPTYTATAVERLLNQGMVILGKTNCDEFAMGTSNENSYFGAVKNPHDRTRVAGGSSGGSAAAVAGNLAPLALGSDTGGSVRLPASFCGAWGLKPTYGRISRHGLIAMASSLDTVGIFARTAEDTAALLRIMAGPDEHDATAADVAVDEYSMLVKTKVRSVRIGISREYTSAVADPNVAALIRVLMDRYAKIPGVELVEVSLPHTEVALATYYIITPAEVSTNLSRYDGLRYGRTGADGVTLETVYRRNRIEGLGPEVRRRIMLGTFVLSAGYYDAYYARASRVRTLVSNDFDEAFKFVDMLLTPTAPTTAFRLGEKSDPLALYLMDVCTVAANLAGVPAVSYPAGTIDGLPVGLQLIGPKWSEGQLLAVGRMFEQAGRTF